MLEIKEMDQRYLATFKRGTWCANAKTKGSLLGALHFNRHWRMCGVYQSRIHLFQIELSAIRDGVWSAESLPEKARKAMEANILAHIQRESINLDCSLIKVDSGDLSESVDVANALKKYRQYAPAFIAVARVEKREKGSDDGSPEN